MEQIVLIGFGAIGIPIAWHLNEWYGDKFALVATGQRRKKMEKKHYQKFPQVLPLVCMVS